MRLRPRVASGALALLTCTGCGGGAGGSEEVHAAPGAVSVAPPRTSASSIQRQLCNADDLHACETLCSEGSPLSCTRWAHMLRVGVRRLSDEPSRLGEDWSLPAAPAMARSLYLKACKDGYAHACAAAAEMLEVNEGGEADLIAALELHRRACLGGSAVSCYRLGTAFGGTADARERRQFLARACDFGSKLGCDELESCFSDRRNAELCGPETEMVPPRPIVRQLPGLACPFGTSAFREVTRMGTYVSIDRPRIFCARGDRFVDYSLSHGPMLEWASLEDEAASNGHLHIRGAFQDGRPTGTWEFFDLHGATIAVGRYVDGVRDGLWKEVDETGEHSVRYDRGGRD